MKRHPLSPARMALGALLTLVTVFASAQLAIAGTAPTDQEPKAEPLAAGSTVPVYRMYNPYTGAHAYTPSANERDANFAQGWDYEGIAWIAPERSNTPVYRLYNPSNGDHHYTTDGGEYDSLERQGWRKEGVAWYSDDAQTVPVYRLYNYYLALKGAGSHHFTYDQNEYDTLGQSGWQRESVSWYASAKTIPNAPTKDQVALNSLNGWWNSVGMSGMNYSHFVNGRVYSYLYNPWDGRLEYYGSHDTYVVRSDWHPQSAIETGTGPCYLVRYADVADSAYVYGDGHRDILGSVSGANLEHASASSSLGRASDVPQALKDFAVQHER